MTRPIHALALLHNRQQTASASRTAMELAAAQQRARDKVTQARDKLRDVITATGMPAFQGVAILAAAESYAKAATRAVSALPSADPEPAAGETGEGGAQ